MEGILWHIRLHLWSDIYNFIFAITVGYMPVFNKQEEKVTYLLPCLILSKSSLVIHTSSIHNCLLLGIVF